MRRIAIRITMILSVLLLAGASTLATNPWALQLIQDLRPAQEFADNNEPTTDGFGAGLYAGNLRLHDEADPLLMRLPRAPFAWRTPSEDEAIKSQLFGLISDLSDDQFCIVTQAKRHVDASKWDAHPATELQVRIEHITCAATDQQRPLVEIKADEVAWTRAPEPTVPAET